MNIIWCPTGRDLWFDLTVKMQSDSLAKIAMWLGNDRHAKRVKAQFPGAKVLALYARRWQNQTVPQPSSTHCHNSQLWLNDEWLAATLNSHVIPGKINLGNECYFSNQNTDDPFRVTEFEGVFKILKKLLLQQEMEINKDKCQK